MFNSFNSLSSVQFNEVKLHQQHKTLFAHFQPTRLRGSVEVTSPPAGTDRFFKHTEIVRNHYDLHLISAALAPPSENCVKLNLHFVKE